DLKGASQARAAAAAANPARMPEVAMRDDIEQLFGGVRRTAAGDKGTRGLVVVAPDRKMLLMPALEASDKLTEMAAGMERLIPSAVKRNVAVIGCTELPSSTPNPLHVPEEKRAIPLPGSLTALT